MQGVKKVFLTGGTGFLGSHLALALLEAGHQVTALARPTSAHTARQRMVEVLGRIAEGDLSPQATERLVVLEGDISQPMLGLDQPTVSNLSTTIDEIWHSAASLSFLEDDREEIFRMNVDGAREVLSLASAIPSRRLHHISTAYVAGDRSGVAREDELDVGQMFRNPYEESKCKAETLVGEAHKSGAVVATIYRPSIVIGESATGRATHFHGVYAFIRGLSTVTRRLRRQHPDAEFVELPLRIRGSGDSTLNFVPVDFVTSAIMDLAAQAGSAGGTFHLTNPTATPNRLWLEIVCRQLGVRGVRLVGDDSFAQEPMTKMETLFHRQMTFYSPYLAGEPQFDCTTTVELLTSEALRCPGVTPGFAARMTGWYIDLLNRD